MLLMSNCYFYLVFFTFLAVIVTVESIKCYRCTSTDPLMHPYQCNEFFEDSQLEPESCDDVYGAQYCVKLVGRFEVSGINCFQCYSASDISCTDLLVSDGSLQPQPCDHIHEAQYCIKYTGGIGTKRYCSAADLGNYCNDVRQPGDIMEYRSCYYTCTGDGCNTAAIPKAGLLPMAVFVLAISLYAFL